MEAQRTHDKFYLNENYKNEPKEYYRFTLSEIEKDFRITDDEESLSVLDIGCETGSFLYFFHRKHSKIHLCGMDVMDELLDHVNDGFGEDEKISVIRGDISDKNSLPSEKFDIICMMGVIAIFDDFRLVLDNMMSLLSDQGCAYVFSGFNPEDVDVLLRCRRSNEDGPWERGWNCFSLKSITTFCDQRSWKIEIIPFKIPFPIPKHENDPFRTWTEEMKDGLMVINGMQMRNVFYLLKISRK